MSAGILAMPPKKGGKSDESASQKAKTLYTAQVKLRQEFQEQLAAVAEDLGKFQGELVEAQMGKFIRQEFARVMRKRREEADRILRDLERD